MALNNEASFRELDDIFKEYAKKADNLGEVLQTGADAFVKDLKSLPSPRSNIHKAGYTHMIDTFTSKPEDEGVLVGWGKYYGRMVESGTKKMAARPHFYPLFKRNKDRYFNLMITKFHGGR